MRALTGLIVVAAAIVAAPAPAEAETPMCPETRPADNALADRLIPYLTTNRPTPTATPPGGPGTAPTVTPVVSPGNGEAAAAVKAVLGAQEVDTRLDWYRQGWSVAFSPGVHDATTARTAIRAFLAARVSPGEVDYLDSTLSLLPTPYPAVELEEIRAALFAVAIPNGISYVSAYCGWSDGWRVQVSVAESETPELRAQIEALVAPYGDKVRVRYGAGWPGQERYTLPMRVVPAPPPRPALKVRDYVSLPRTSRCVRGGVVRAKPRARGVERVRLAIGKRSAAARGGKAVRLRLKARRSRVTVTVLLDDGTSAIGQMTFRRC